MTRKKFEFFFQMKNFTILSNFFAKVRQEYQNIFPQLYKNHHCRSVSLIVLSQKPSQNKHFNVGHPVYALKLCFYYEYYDDECSADQDTSLMRLVWWVGLMFFSDFLLSIEIVNRCAVVILDRGRLCLVSNCLLLLISMP